MCRPDDFPPYDDEPMTLLVPEIGGERLYIDMLDVVDPKQAPSWDSTPYTEKTMTLLSEVRAQHVEDDRTVPRYCAFCDRRWPCDAIRLADDYEKAVALLRDMVNNCDGDSCVREITAAEAFLGDGR